MIYDFDTFKVTDDTREESSRVLLLKCQQNSVYVGKRKHITVGELIDRLGLHEIAIIGVTGTNGKTTTTAAIYSLLNDLGYKAALQGTRGFYIGDEFIAPKTHTTPPILQTLYHLYLAKKAGAKFFVMEVSSHAIDQNRIEGLNFALKVLTNITQDHLDYHKSMDQYIATKSRFFADESLKLINKEEKKIEYNIANVRTYGVEEMATYKIAAYSLEAGISAILQYGAQMVDFYSPLLGLFNLYNITAAIAATHLLTNEPLEKICEVVEHFAGVRGRMEIVSYQPLVVVDFAHTPDGMQKVLESFPGKKIAVVFGAGGDRDKDKRAKMGAVAARFATKLYITSDNPRSEDPKAIIADIAQGIDGNVYVQTIVDRKEAIERAINELQKDEILLVLGKGDEEYMEIADKKIPFNDVAVIEEILNQQVSR